MTSSPRVIQVSDCKSEKAYERIICSIRRFLEEQLEDETMICRYYELLINILNYNLKDADDILRYLRKFKEHPTQILLKGVRYLKQVVQEGDMAVSGPYGKQASPLSPLQSNVTVTPRRRVPQTYTEAIRQNERSDYRNGGMRPQGMQTPQFLASIQDRKGNTQTLTRYDNQLSGQASSEEYNQNRESEYSNRLSNVQQYTQNVYTDDKVGSTKEYSQVGSDAFRESNILLAKLENLQLQMEKSSIVNSLGQKQLEQRLTKLEEAIATSNAGRSQDDKQACAQDSGAQGQAQTQGPLMASDIISCQQQTSEDRQTQTDSCEDAAYKSKLLQVLPTFMKNTTRLIQYERDELLKWSDCKEELNTYVVLCFSEMREEFLVAVQRLQSAKMSMCVARCNTCRLKLRQLKYRIRIQYQQSVQPKLEMVQTLRKKRQQCSQSVSQNDSLATQANALREKQNNLSQLKQNYSVTQQKLRQMLINAKAMTAKLRVRQSRYELQLLRMRLYCTTQPLLHAKRDFQQKLQSNSLLIQLLITEQYGSGIEYPVSPNFPSQDSIASAETQFLETSQLTAQKVDEVTDILKRNVARYCLLGNVPVFDGLNLRSQAFSSNEQLVLSLACCMSTNARFQAGFLTRVKYNFSQKLEQAVIDDCSQVLAREEPQIVDVCASAGQDLSQVLRVALLKILSENSC